MTLSKWKNYEVMTTSRRLGQFCFVSNSIPIVISTITIICHCNCISEAGIDCELRPFEEIGRFTIEHNFNFTSEIKSLGAWRIPVSYTGFTTDDELMAAINMFAWCEQKIEVINCPEMENAVYWISLTGDKWKPNQQQDCRWVIGHYFRISKGC